MDGHAAGRQVDVATGAGYRIRPTPAKLERRVTRRRLEDLAFERGEDLVAQTRFRYFRHSCHRGDGSFGIVRLGGRAQADNGAIRLLSRLNEIGQARGTPE